MTFLNAFVTTGLQYIIMIIVVVGAVMLGATLRKKKNEASKDNEE